MKTEHCGLFFENKNGSGLSIHCMKNGSLEDAGRILNEFYNDEEKTRAMFSLGDIEYLRKEIYPKEGFSHFYNTPCPDTTIFRNRDIGYKLHRPIAYDSVDHYLRVVCEATTNVINFLWRKGEWYIMMPFKKSDRNFDHFQKLKKKYTGIDNNYIFKLSEIIEIIDANKGKSIGKKSVKELSNEELLDFLEFK